MALEEKPTVENELVAVWIHHVPAYKTHTFAPPWPTMLDLPLFYACALHKSLV